MVAEMWSAVQVMSRKVQPTYTPEEVKAAFKVFETPSSGLPSGHVKTTALERALTTYGTEKLTLEEAQDLLSQVRSRTRLRCPCIRAWPRCACRHGCTHALHAAVLGPAAEGSSRSVKSGPPGVRCPD